MTAISASSPINPVNPLVNEASDAKLGTAAGAASMLVLKKSLEQQASSAVELTESLLQPTLANLGQLGTKVNTYV